MRIKKLPVILALFTGFGLGALLSVMVSVYAGKEEAAPTATATPKSENQKLPLDDIRTFAEVMGRIKTSYVEPVTDQKLLEGAIKGMLEGLDPHSSYLDEKDFDDLQASTSGEFGGLGIEVGMEDGFVKVISPIDDTPADRAGLKSGDLIIKLDETSVKGLKLSEAVDKMRGTPGTTIVITVVREGEPKPFTKTIKREIIKVVSVKSKIIDDDYGYLRITQFQTNTGKDLRKAIDKIQAENKHIKGFVLDLRNNPGGLLQSAIDVADTFLSDGLIVYTKGRIPNSDTQYSATKESNDITLPLVVLINSGSASASEIVAGALQDHHRAVLMGSDSFGKGSVQTILPLSNNSALKLTTAIYYTPSGRSIQAQGIVPDIKVDAAKITQKSDIDYDVKEADLSGHLKNGNGGADKPSKLDNKTGDDEPKTDDDKKVNSNDRTAEDYQLNEAVNLLKALHVLNKQKEKQATVK